ncbi:MAG: PIN domain-containing protein [bacterium]|nr:PIN domain-containing protein [bacterium]
MVADERSEALRVWLAGRRSVSSDLLRTEARRAVLDEPAALRRRCEELLGAVASVRLRPAVLDRAGRLPLRRLRSLDATHLAAAQELEDDLAGVAGYDLRQLDAAADVCALASAVPARPADMAHLRGHVECGLMIRSLRRGPPPTNSPA